MAARTPLDIFNDAVDAASDIFRPPDNSTSTFPSGLSPTPSIRGLVETGYTAGQYHRQMVTWRTPAYGYVQMYLNPQDLRITDRKISTTTRTKAGFIYQYAGEDLTHITLSGTTGSGGIDAINILDAIYKSEQQAFNGIAEILDQRVTTAQIQQFLGTATNAISNGLGVQELGSVFEDLTNISIDGDLGAFLGNIVQEVSLNMFEQPFPTLASLAAAVEMYFQGMTYRGYFESFTYNENGASPGIFEYSLEFVAYAKSGKRTNFMPWHRKPLAPADVEVNPLTFDTSADPANIGQLAPFRPESTQRSQLKDLSVAGLTQALDLNKINPAIREQLVAQNPEPTKTPSRRVTSFGTGSSGRSLKQNLNLNDIIE